MPPFTFYQSEITKYPSVCMYVCLTVHAWLERCMRYRAIGYYIYTKIANGKPRASTRTRRSVWPIGHAAMAKTSPRPTNLRSECALPPIHTARHELSYVGRCEMNRRLLATVHRVLFVEWKPYKCVLKYKLDFLLIYLPTPAVRVRFRLIMLGGQQSTENYSV